MLVHLISGADVWQPSSLAELGVQAGNQLSGATMATSLLCQHLPVHPWILLGQLVPPAWMFSQLTLRQAHNMALLA